MVDTLCVSLRLNQLWLPTPFQIMYIIPNDLFLVIKLGHSDN